MGTYTVVRTYRTYRHNVAIQSVLLIVLYNSIHNTVDQLAVTMMPERIQPANMFAPPAKYCILVDSSRLASR